MLLQTYSKNHNDSMYTQTYKKKILFLSQYKRISGKNIDFDNKSIKKSAFYKNKSVFRIEDIDVNKIFVSKKNPMVQKKLLNTLLGIMIKMKLNHYV